MREFDYSKLSTLRWDAEILSLVAKIHECKGRQEMFLSQKPAALDKLVEIAKIQSTEASNKIEALSPHQLASSSCVRKRRHLVTVTRKR